MTNLNEFESRDSLVIIIIIKNIYKAPKSIKLSCSRRTRGKTTHSKTKFDIEQLHISDIRQGSFQTIS